MRLEYTLNPRRIALFLGVVSLYLAIQSLIGEYLLERVLSSEIDSFVTSIIDLFSVNSEETIPTWYSTLILFVSSMLLAFIAAAKQVNQDPYRRYWVGLAVVFLYLSMDEGAVIHEIFVDPLQAAFDATGYLAFAWQIVAVPMVIIFALLYLRFLLHLQSRTRNLFILAGLLYVGGALVVEAISANRWYLDGGITFQYLAIGTVEELFEMLGVAVFIFALLTYVVEVGNTAVLGISSTTRAAFSVSNNSGTNMTLSSRWLLGGAVALVVGANLALFSWASHQRSDLVSTDSPTIPFYQKMVNRYAGQGVIILRINEVLEPDNPAAPQVATSLLTLFDDVLVVALPPNRSSIAFVAQDLPFDQSTLSEVLSQSGEEQFTILDTAAVRVIADNFYPALTNGD
jgi:hypothetical protein